MNYLDATLDAETFSQKARAEARNRIKSLERKQRESSDDSGHSEREGDSTSNDENQDESDISFDYRADAKRRKGGAKKQSSERKSTSRNPYKLKDVFETRKSTELPKPTARKRTSERRRTNHTRINAQPLTSSPRRQPRAVESPSVSSVNGAGEQDPVGPPPKKYKTRGSSNNNTFLVPPVPAVARLQEITENNRVIVPGTSESEDILESSIRVEKRKELSSRNVAKSPSKPSATSIPQNEANDILLPMNRRSREILSVAAPVPRGEPIQSPVRTSPRRRSNLPCSPDRNSSGSSDTDVEEMQPTGNLATGNRSAASTHVVDRSTRHSGVRDNIATSDSHPQSSSKSEGINSNNIQTENSNSPKPRTSVASKTRSTSGKTQPRAVEIPPVSAVRESSPSGEQDSIEPPAKKNKARGNSKVAPALAPVESPEVIDANHPVEPATSKTSTNSKKRGFLVPGAKKNQKKQSKSVAAPFVHPTSPLKNVGDSNEANIMPSTPKEISREILSVASPREPVGESRRKQFKKIPQRKSPESDDSESYESADEVQAQRPAVNRSLFASTPLVNKAPTHSNVPDDIATPISHSQNNGEADRINRNVILTQNMKSKNRKPRTSLASRARSTSGKRRSMFDIVRESGNNGTASSTTSKAASKPANQKEKVRERYVGNDIFGNYHILKESQVLDILRKTKPDHELGKEELKLFTLRINHLLEDLFVHLCETTKQPYGFVPFSYFLSTLIDNEVLPSNTTGPNLVQIMRQNLSNVDFKRSEGILYPLLSSDPSRFDNANFLMS